jgi:hypothetical protein
MLIGELGKRFPNHDLMNALDIIFPRYWLQHNCDEFYYFANEDIIGALLCNKIYEQRGCK